MSLFWGIIKHKLILFHQQQLLIFNWLSAALTSRRHNMGLFVVRCIVCMSIKGWGGERMRRWWWFPRSLCSHFRSVWSAGSWRCPRCTWGTRRRECASQTGSRECCQQDQRRRERWLNLNKHEPAHSPGSLSLVFTFVRSVPCIPQSTSASPLDRWFQKRQQELQTDGHSAGCCCALLLPDKYVEGPTKHWKINISFLDCHTCETAALKSARRFVSHCVSKIRKWSRRSSVRS